jgi:hypothetical protein
MRSDSTGQTFTSDPPGELYDSSRNNRIATRFSKTPEGRSSYFQNFIAASTTDEQGNL